MKVLLEVGIISRILREKLRCVEGKANHASPICLKKEIRENFKF